MAGRALLLVDALCKEGNCSLTIAKHVVGFILRADCAAERERLYVLLRKPDVVAGLTQSVDGVDASIAAPTAVLEELSKMTPSSLDRSAPWWPSAVIAAAIRADVPPMPDIGELRSACGCSADEEEELLAIVIASLWNNKRLVSVALAHTRP